MPWSALGLVGMLSLWAACGLLPWCVALIARRGVDAFRTLPLAIVAGMAGGVAVALFAKGGTGVALSLATAALAGVLATSAPLIQGILQGKPS